LAIRKLSYQFEKFGKIEENLKMEDYFIVSKITIEIGEWFV